MCWISLLWTESNLAEVTSILFKYIKCRQNSWRKRMRGIWPERRSQLLRINVYFRMLHLSRDLDAYNYLLCLGHVVIKWRDRELKQDRFDLKMLHRIHHRFILLVWSILSWGRERERERLNFWHSCSGYSYGTIYLRYVLIYCNCKSDSIQLRVWQEYVSEENVFILKKKFHSPAMVPGSCFVSLTK